MLVNLDVEHKSSDLNSKKYYPFLDALRAISILWVIAHHANYFFQLKKYDTNVFTHIMRGSAELGFLGVDMFFVTSGFLITGLLMEEFLQGQVRVQRFYARRFFKIVPHYYFIIVIALGILSVYCPRETIKPVQMLGYLTLMQNYLKHPVVILGHLWSISIEEHFYLIYPLLLFLISAIGKTKQMRFKAILFVLVFLIILENLIRFICFKGPHDGYTFFYQMTHVRFDALIFGCLLRFVEEWFIVSKFRKFYGMVFFMIAFLIYFSFTVKFDKTIWFYSTLAYLASGFILVAALYGFKPLVDIGRSKFLVWIGKNSYGIYLWHYILIFPIISIIDPARIDWKITMLYVMLSVCGGALSTATLEKYFLAMRQRLVS